MEHLQLNRAKELITYLEEFDFIKSVEIIGSLKSGTYDQYSDIDIRVNVSGTDNGKILLMLPQLISKKFKVIYTAFAPRFAPDLYVVSLGIKDLDIFHFIDIECVAEPHVNSLSKSDIKAITNFKDLKLKLYIGLLKKLLRNEDIKEELSFLSKKVVDTDNSIVILKDEFLNLISKENIEMNSIINQAINIINNIKQ